MAFLQTVLKYVSGGRQDPTIDLGVSRRAAEDAWGLDEADRTPLPADSSTYDWTQWRKKFQRVLDGLPDSEPEWAPMMAEARALGFGESTVHNAELQEFTLLIRRVVADCVLTPDEHIKLEAARRLLGISSDEAELIAQTVIREASQFFGQPVRDL